MLPGEQPSPFTSPLATPAPFKSPLLPTSSAPSSGSASPIPDLTLLVMTPTVIAALVARKKGRKWGLPMAVLAGTLTIAGLTHATGVTSMPMPFVSPPPPPPGCMLPAALGDTRVISYTYG